MIQVKQITLKIMIKTVNLQKIFRTEEVQTLALNNVNIEVEKGDRPVVENLPC